MGQIAAEIFRQRESAVVALVRFLLQALQANRFQIDWQFRVELARRHGLIGDHLEDGVERRARAERRPAGYHLVEQRTQRIDIRGRPNILAGGLLRGHVAGRAQDGPGLGQMALRLHGLGQTEVGDLGRAQERHCFGRSSPPSLRRDE